MNEFFEWISLNNFLKNEYFTAQLNELLNKLEKWVVELICLFKVYY